jgi:hypothetical protein
MHIVHVVSRNMYVKLPRGSGFGDCRGSNIAHCQSRILRRPLQRRHASKFGPQIHIRIAERGGFNEYGCSTSLSESQASGYMNNAGMQLDRYDATRSETSNRTGPARLPLTLV